MTERNHRSKAYSFRPTRTVQVFNDTCDRCREHVIFQRSGSLGFLEVRRGEDSKLGSFVTAGARIHLYAYLDKFKIQEFTQIQTLLYTHKKKTSPI